MRSLIINFIILLETLPCSFPFTSMVSALSLIDLRCAPDCINDHRSLSNKELIVCSYGERSGLNTTLSGRDVLRDSKLITSADLFSLTKSGLGLLELEINLPSLKQS